MYYIVGYIGFYLVWKQPPLMNPSRRSLTLPTAFYHLLTHITHTSSLSPLPSPPLWAHSPIISSVHLPRLPSISLSFPFSLALSLSPLPPSLPSLYVLRVFRAVSLFRLEFLFFSAVQFLFFSAVQSHVELPLS